MYMKVCMSCRSWKTFNVLFNENRIYSKLENIPHKNYYFFFFRFMNLLFISSKHSML